MRERDEIQDTIDYKILSRSTRRNNQLDKKPVLAAAFGHLAPVLAAAAFGHFAPVLAAAAFGHFVSPRRGAARPPGLEHSNSRHQPTIIPSLVVPYN